MTVCVLTLFIFYIINVHSAGVQKKLPEGTKEGIEAVNIHYLVNIWRIYA